MLIALVIIILISGMGIMILKIMRKRMAYRIKNNLPISKPVFYIMKVILGFKNKPKKINKVLRISGLNESMRVLDYGCGIGSYSIESAKIVGNSGKVIGADISPVMIRKMETKVQKENLTNVETMLVKAPVEISNYGFDFVLLIDVIHMINDRIKLIKDLLSKLKREGKLLIKFEHMQQAGIENILKNISGINRTNINEKFWVLQKQYE